MFISETPASIISDICNIEPPLDRVEAQYESYSDDQKNDEDTPANSAT